MLRVEGVSAGYGAAQVLHNISFHLKAGHSLALLGRNGMGKSTLIETLMGNTQRHAGRVFFQGQEITPLAPYQRARQGLAWVPQERAVFPSLTVEQNLLVVHQVGEWSLERVYALFPRLAQRRNHRGQQLSGGEQQMVAIGRALMTNPRLLLLDEPMEGLAPVIVEEVVHALQQMRQSGLPYIMVEQQPRLALLLTDEAVVLERGQVVLAASSAELLQQPALLSRYLAL